MKYGIGNYFSLPNEIFLLGLSSGELAVYSFLKRCENRKTHQCWPSYRTIGQAVRMSENTVRKYTPVSYTHPDVYKRQPVCRLRERPVDTG